VDEILAPGMDGDALVPALFSATCVAVDPAREDHGPGQIDHDRILRGRLEDPVAPAHGLDPLALDQDRPNPLLFLAGPSGVLVTMGRRGQTTEANASPSEATLHPARRSL
jgi:hypothetical protein